MQKRLSDIGEIILGHTFRGAIEAAKEGNVAVLQAKNIKREGVLELDEIVNTMLEKTRSQAFVTNGDVLLSNRGTFRAAVYEGNASNVLAASSIYIIRMKNPDVALPEYISVFLNSTQGQYGLEAMNRGTLIKSLPKRSLIDLKVPVPPLKTQKLIVDIYKNYKRRSALYNQKSQLEEEIANQAITSLLST